MYQTQRQELYKYISEGNHKITELIRIAQAQREDPKNQWMYDEVHKDRRAHPRQENESNKKYILQGDLIDAPQDDSDQFPDRLADDHFPDLVDDENQDQVLPINLEILQERPKIKGGKLKLASKKKLEQKVMSLYENRSPEQQRYFDQF